ncbi:LLM class flavin-dependent oxidoreductase [Curtobacterium sp. 24E2]|nr:LLM class flavin-dependent oxidoreductase [Curtobacterium sp. 24E2]
MSSDDIGRLTASQRAALRDQLMAQREARAAESAEPAESVALPRTSLYFFANAAEESAPDYFDFVLEASRRADAAGLHAVWIPERHFVDFGGLSPNPAILASAIASVTTSIQVRAGSVAAPLSHPARIAEDWAMVDNISRGRAGISFASGWHPNDFVLSRHPFEERRDVTARTITEVRHLLSGVSCPIGAHRTRRPSTSAPDLRRFKEATFRCGSRRRAPEPPSRPQAGRALAS